MKKRAPSGLSVEITPLNAVIASTILIISAFLWYFPSWYYPFQFDDVPNILKFFEIRHKTFADLYLINPRWISYWLNTLYFKISRFDPFWYRLGNTIFHLASSLLVFKTLSILLGRAAVDWVVRWSKWIAFLTAGLFLLHPLQTQTVSYVIQGQLEGLSGLGVLLMILLFLKWEASQGYCRYGYFLSLLLLAHLICGTKEIAIVSPLMIMLVDWFFVAQGSLKTMFSRWWLYASVSMMVWGTYLYLLKPAFFKNALGMNMVMYNNVGNVLTPDPDAFITAYSFCISQPKVILHYFSLFLCPWRMRVDYDWKLCESVFSIDCVIPVMILSALLLFLLRRFLTHKKDLMVFCLAWFFIAILPRSSIIPSTELLMDYKTYLASVGMYLLMSLGIFYVILNYAEKIIQGSGRVSSSDSTEKYIPGTQPGGLLISAHPHAFSTYALYLLIFSFFGFLSFQRNKVWRSAEEFWMNIIQKSPQKARAYNNYGVALSEKGKYADALPYFEKAIAMDTVYADPRNNLSVALSAANRIDDAIKVTQEAIRINPRYPEGYNNLGSFFMQQKRYDEAEKVLHQALSLRPHYGKACYNLGRLCTELGKLDDAYQWYKRCCTEADFDNETGFFAFGMICLHMQKYDEALWAFEKTVQLNGNNFDAAFNRANCHYFLKKYNEAITYYQLLAQKYPQEPRVWYNWGEAYFQLKQYERALPMFERVAELKPYLGSAEVRIAQLHHFCGNTSKARQQIEKIVSSSAPEEQKQLALRLLSSFDYAAVGKPSR